MGGGMSKKRPSAREDNDHLVVLTHETPPEEKASEPSAAPVAAPTLTPAAEAERTRQRRQTLQQLEATKRVRRPSIDNLLENWSDDQLEDMQQKILAHPAELDDFSQFMISHVHEVPVQFILAVRAPASFRAPPPPSFFYRSETPPPLPPQTQIFEYTKKFGYDPPPPERAALAYEERRAEVERIHAAFIADGAAAPGLSSKTRTLFEAEMAAKNVAGCVFSRAKGEAIAALARHHLSDFVALQESKFNVAGGYAAGDEDGSASAPEKNGASSPPRLTELAKTHFAQDSKQLLREIGKMVAERPSRESETQRLVDDIAKIRATNAKARHTDSGGAAEFVKRTFFRKTAASRPAAPVGAA